MARTSEDFPAAVRIPADIEQPDKLLGPFTARQTAILAVASVLLWGGYLIARTLMPIALYLVFAIPIGVLVLVMAVGTRDGVSLDRMALAGLRYARAPKRLVPTANRPSALPSWLPPELTKHAEPAPAPLQLPAESVDATGLLNLGRDGAAAIGSCSTVNFALRTTDEQQALVAAFGRWLNATGGPVQIVVRAHRLDLALVTDALRDAAPGLPHPELEASARAHADFLDQLADQRDLLVRQALLVVRHFGRGRTVAAQRLLDAARGLTAAEVTVQPLDASGIGAQMHLAIDPDQSQVPGRPAAPGAAITHAQEGDWT